MDKNTYKNSTAEKITSVMMGHAVADAVGVPAEFKSRSYLEANPVSDMTGYGTHNMPKGCFSDDTSMSIAALDVLKSGWVDYSAIMDNLVLWVYSDKFTATGVTFDVGGSCMSAISSYRYSDRKSAFGHAPMSERSNGNGSLMRIHPFVLYYYFTSGELVPHIRDIEMASALTHPHPRSLVACGIYAFVLWALLDKPTKASVYRGLAMAREYYRDNEEYHTYRRLFEEIGNPECELPDIHTIESSGYVVHSLEAAVWCLRRAESYRDCVLSAVNLGEDTDTVAAIAGGLAGALFGLESIPDTWRAGLIGGEKIEAMCREAASFWCENRDI